MALHVIPVIDVRSGRAVHARGGRRAAYGPVASVLAPGDDPFELALAFRERLGLNELYIADLDAIEGAPPDLDLVRRLAREGFHVWLDAGLRDEANLKAIEGAGTNTVIAASETLRGLDQLADLARRARSQSLVFGLDLKAGRPLLAPGSIWPPEEPGALLEAAIAVGLGRVLILDVARVGSGQGVMLPSFVSAFRREHPAVEVSVGGGVAGRSDLDTLEQLGVSAVLVGSALHDGRISRGDLERVRQ